MPAPCIPAFATALAHPHMTLFLRLLWSACILAILYFALASGGLGGVGGARYHALAFLVLGLLTPAAFPNGRLLLIWLVLLALGGFIEVAQWMLRQNRVASWEDFAIDAIAASLAVLSCCLWRRLRTRASERE